MNTIFHWIDNFLCWFVANILPVVFPIVLVIIGVIIAIAFISWTFSLVEKIYFGCCYLSSLATEPLVRLHYWRQEKRQERRAKKDTAGKNITKKNLFAKLKMSSWDSPTVIVFVFVLFLGSLAYLIISAIQSGDFWGFMEADFLGRLPTIALITNEFADNIVDGMASAVIICLLLYYVNKKIGDLDEVSQFLFNIAFIFIGWAIGNINPMFLLIPIYAPLFFGQLLIDAELLFLTDIPILWHIAHISLFILGSACIVLSIWLFIILGLAALQEFISPLSVTFVFFIISVIICNFVPESAATVVVIISLFAGFIFYQVRRVTELALIEKAAESTAKNHIDSILDWIVDTFDNIKDFVIEWAGRICEWIKSTVQWIKRCFSKK